jgi:drug/metabolite transporter superfamily protein YnfA
VATRRETYCTRLFGQQYHLCAWDNPNFAACRVWKDICGMVGIFTVSAIVWGRIVDRKKPDRHETIGSIVVLVGALVIFMSHTEEVFYFNV